MSTALGMPGVGAPSGVPTPAAGCDCRVCPFYMRNPAAVEPLCSGTNSDCRYCGCARAGAPTAQGCSQCPIRCGSRVDITDWMRDVGGTFGFDDIQIPGDLPAGLPRFIPQIDGSKTPQLHAAASWPAYALGLRRAFSPASHRLYPRVRDAIGAGGAAAVLGLPTDAGEAGNRPLTVLLGYGEDPLVEAFWTRRHNDGLWTDLAGLGFDLVLTPNASMYGSQPRAEMMLNFRRNMLMAAEAAAAGITAVPNIYWFRLEDLERYLDWVGDQTCGPPAVAVNLQTFRTEEDWNAMAMPGLTLLALATPSDLPVIITGPSRPDRIGQLVNLFADRLILISQTPVQYAQHGALMTVDGRMDVKASRADLFARNTRFLSGLLG